MTWATNWDSSEGTGKLLKSALNDLRSAMEERIEGVNRTMPADVVEIETGDLVYSSWFTAFQSEMTNLFAFYIDHTDSGGSWNGDTTLPIWTETTILAEIGDASRLDAPTDPLVSAGWMYQQYKMLNVLRWGAIDRVGNEIVKYEGSTIAQSKIGEDNDQSTAEAEYTASAWTSDTIVALLANAGNNGNYRYNRFRAKMKYDTNNTFGKSVDYYFFITAPTGGFNANGESLTEDTYYKDTSAGLSETTSEVIEAGAYFSGVDDLPIYNTASFYGWRADTAYIILKYDGANGFTYKDWV